MMSSAEEDAVAAAYHAYLADLIIAGTYFAIAITLALAVLYHRKQIQMPWRVIVLFILFAMFVLLCGVTHLLHGLGMNGRGTASNVLNWITAIVSMATGFFLYYMVPFFFAFLDSQAQIAAAREQEMKIANANAMQQQQYSSGAAPAGVATLSS